MGINKVAYLPIVNFFLDDFVMVGTKEGHLLIYKITFTEEKSSPEIAIALSNKNFTFSIGTGGTRKPIIQIGIIPEHKVLIALTTGMLVLEHKRY